MTKIILDMRIHKINDDQLHERKTLSSSISSTGTYTIRTELKFDNFKDSNITDNFGHTSEDFIKFLDTYFKPEINLRDD